MKQIIQIDGNNVFIGTETNEIISVVLTSVNYENPQVGDKVEIYKNGDDVIVIKSEEGVADNKSAFLSKNNNGSSIPNAKKPKAKKGGKKKWIVIGIVLVLLLIVGIRSCGAEETYEWPDSEMANMLPEPDGKIISLSESEGEYLDATVKIDDGYCKTYIDECIEKGFDVDKDISSYEGEYNYTAKNETGWQVNVYDYDGEMEISLYSPEWLVDDTEEDVLEKTDAGTESDSEELVDGMRPEFKEAMDSYEAFYDEYCDFMEEYAADSSNLTMISEYSDMLSKASEMDEKFKEWDDSDLNDAELQYYLEVNERVSQKLLDVSLELE